MKLYILAVGNKMPGWVNTGYLEYIKRLPHEITVDLIEVKPEKRAAGKQVEQILRTEKTRIISVIPIGCRVVVLDERGKHWSTVKLSDVISGWMRDGGDTVFIIGGADGLHPEIKGLASEVLALSALTMPHGLIRVLLAEQLYRAISIIKRHPYHRR